MKKVVLDASIAIKWFFDEVGSKKALQFQKQLENGLIKVFVPQIFFFEVVNVIKTKPASTSDHVKRVIKIIFNLPFNSEKVASRLLLRTNFYAQKYGLTIYDASYVALARMLKIDFITTDEKLVKKTKLKFIKSLKEF